VWLGVDLGDAVTTVFKRGDMVEIITDDRTVPGMVTLASSNGVSLVLMFDALIGGHAGMMAVLHKGGDQYFSIIDEQQVRLKRA
jgi:hypothetical protein